MEVISSVRKKENMGMEETELRLGLGLGLPGKGRAETELVRKRGFSESESETTVDLKLNLSSTTSAQPKEKTLLPNDPAKPPAKAQVVGWPPVRSYRKNIMKSSNNGSGKEEAESEKGSPNANANNANTNGSFVKVSMDGAPYLRKVDLNIYSSYQHLSDALAKMFGSFTLGNCGAQGMKDFMNESKLMNLLNSSDYVPTYEDKDGDWMLVGDVPWEMFVESCKRLRIMKGKEAIGLAPRAMEKCKNRS